jgi:gliding motility-associated-like protein
MAGCSYTWTVNGGPINGSSNSNSINVTWTGTGSGTISVTVTTASGCSASATQNVSLIVLPNPVVAGSNTTCRNTSSAYSVNGTAGSSYAWSTVNGTITGSNSNSTVQVNWNTTGSGSVTVVETNSLGCSQSFTLPVTIFQQPVPSVSGNSIACVNNTAFTYTSPWYNNTTYTWSVSGGTIASTNGSNTVNVLWNSPGANYVSLTVSNSVCDSTIMFPVNVGSINPPTAQANTTSGCSPLSVVFSGNNPTAGQTYSWTFGDQLYSSSANPAHTYTIPGVYNLVLFTQNNGCRDSASATIRVFDAPRAAFIHNFEDSVYIIGESILKITNRTTGGTSWFWTFGSNDTSNAFEPKHSYITPGEYLIRLLTVNADGCVDTAERPIRVRDRETIYIPNAFTPNGDNTNDYFSMLSTNIESASVTIFNRWGQIIYTADNKDFKWDGTYFGKPAELGVYVYKINAVGEGGSSYALIGTVSLMR